MKRKLGRNEKRRIAKTVLRLPDLEVAKLRKSLFVTTSVMAVALGTIITVAAVEAQDKQGKGKGVRDMTQHTSQVKPGLYFIQGAGGNSLLRVTTDGLILMDGKLPGNYEPLMEQVKAVSNQPIKYLINTHHHEDHTGNNAKFLAAGVQIVASEELKNQLQHYSPPGGKPADPTITYKGSEYTLKLGGAEVDLYHFGRAHTGGDSVVYFPDLKVVALSDVIGPERPARISRAAEAWSNGLRCSPAPSSWIGIFAFPVPETL